MPEATAPATTQGDAAEDAQGASGTPAQGAVPDTAHGATGETGTATVEALTRKVQELERDNRSYRKREKDREDAERTKAEADLTEVEKLRLENERLAASLQERDQRERAQSLRLSAVQEAQRLGFRDTEDAITIVQAKVADVEWDKDGTPRNVAKLLEEYAKVRPHLVVSTDFGGGSRGQPATSGTPDMNALLRSAAAAKTGR